MCKRNSPCKYEISTGCVRETPVSAPDMQDNSLDKKKPV